MVYAARHSSYFYFVYAEYWVVLVDRMNSFVPPCGHGYLLYLQYKLQYASRLVDTFKTVFTVPFVQTVFVILISPPFCPRISLRYKTYLSTVCFRT
jgi:hypothetical protein